MFPRSALAEMERAAWKFGGVVDVNSSTPPDGGKSSKPRLRAAAAAYVAALKVPLLVLCLFGAALGAYYFIHVSSARDYLNARNFRLLANLGKQIEDTIERDREVLLRLRRILTCGRNNRITRQILQKASPFVPVLPSYTLDWVKDENGEACTGDSDPRSLEETLLQSEDATLSFNFAERESRLIWVRRDARVTEKGEKLAGILTRELETVLEPVLGSELPKSIFDSILVSTTDGRVIFQTGDPKLRITRLDPLQFAGSRTSSTVKFEQLARASGAVDVHLSGRQYQLMVQPCCGRMFLDPEPHTGGSGWILSGLIARQTLSAESAAVSFPMMALLAVALLLALLSWPFVKLRLIGEAEHVRARDVVLVGFFALLGIGLITICGLSVYAFSRLESILDNQLQALARSITSQTKDEVESASLQLATLEHVLREPKVRAMYGPCELDLRADRREQRCAADAAKSKAFEDHDFDAYPFFDSFSLIDEQGLQQWKVAMGPFVTPRISVRSREYFAHWRLKSSSEHLFLQPLRSATTGRNEAILSKQASGWPDPDIKVAALTLPLRALSEPVIAPGFGFAVIDVKGEVLVHSDPSHSHIAENFFTESDGSRRLRALVEARHEEWVDIRYWGVEHRALVTPMEISLSGSPGRSVALVNQPWTLVTFYQKDFPRTVTAEWLVFTLVFMLAYSFIYVIIALSVLCLRPQYRTPWLWPDPARSRAYLDLLPALLMLSAAFAGSLFVLPSDDLLRVAFVLPFVGWVLAYAVLTPRTDRHRLAWAGGIGIALLMSVFLAIVGTASARTGSSFWRLVVGGLVAASVTWTVTSVRRGGRATQSTLAPPVNITYGVAAGVLLFLIAAMPAAAFFRIAHGMQLENLVKYGQLQIALDRSESERRTEEMSVDQLSPDPLTDRIKSRRSALAWKWGVYDDFSFSTSTKTPDVAIQGTLGEPLTLPAVVEEHLPFYSESSVRLRELMHNSTGDQSWRWQHAGNVLTLFKGPQPVLASIIPTVIAWSDFGRLLLLVVAALVSVAAVVWVVRFVIHTIFVVDVIEPIWSGSEALGEIWAPHLFLVASQPVAWPHLATYIELDLAQAPDDDDAERAWFDEQIEQLGQSPTGQNVLILHFERRLQNRRFNARKLALVERIINLMNRTVVVVSAAPPGIFFVASASETEAAGVEGDWSRRWADVLARFVVIPVTAVAPAPASSPLSTAALSSWAAGGWREIVWRLNALGFSHSARFLEDERRDPQVNRLWKDILPYAWHPDRPALDLTQLLVEVGERAESYFREIWATCTPNEKVVLGQIAQEGLVNEKTKRTVRLLMARGLVRRQPHFVLMTETFRRFVLSSLPQTEVRTLEGLEEQSRSAWDMIKVPFLMALIASIAFFLTTQRELANTTLGIITAAATAVPAILKVASLFGGGRRSDA